MDSILKERINLKLYDETGYLREDPSSPIFQYVRNNNQLHKKAGKVPLQESLKKQKEYLDMVKQYVHNIFQSLRDRNIIVLRSDRSIGGSGLLYLPDDIAVKGLEKGNNYCSLMFTKG